MKNAAKPIAKHVVGACQIVLASGRVGIDIMRRIAVEAQRRQQLEILRELHLIGRVGADIGRQSAVRRDDGVNRRRDATGRRIGQARITSRDRRQAQIGARLAAGLARQFDTGSNRVLDDAGGEAAGQIGLVDQIGRVGFALAPFARDRHGIDRIADTGAAGARRRATVECLAERIAKAAWRGDAGEAVVINEACAIGQLEGAAKITFDGRREDVGFGGDDVTQRPGGDTVPIAAVDRHRRHRRAVAVIAAIDQRAGPLIVARLRQIGHAVVRRALLALIDIGQSRLGIVVERCADRRRHAPALGIDVVARRRRHVLVERGNAAGDVTVLAAGVDIGAVAADRGAGGGAFDIGRAGRQLGDVVDGAAGRAAAEGESRRPLVDFNLVGIEQIARVPARIAETVAENITARGKAADDRAVALLAAFASRKRDSRYRTQRVFHADGALFLDDLLRHDVDGLRRILERRLQPVD